MRELEILVESKATQSDSKSHSELDRLIAEGDAIRAARKLGVQAAMESWQRRMNTDPEFRAKAEEQARDDRAMAYREEKAKARAAAGLPSPLPTEYAEQRVLCDWLHARRVIYAANTEGSYHEASGKRGAMRRMIGMKKGRPDIEIFSVVPNAPKARGVGLELKRAKGGKLSDAQVGWGAKLEACGWLWRCCHGADEAIAWLTELGF